MALVYADEMTAISNDYFALDKGKKAFDIAYQTSYLVNLLLKQRKGYFEEMEGGDYFRVLLDYDEVEGDFYTRGDSIEANYVETVNAARFQPKHLVGTGVVTRIDQLKTGGDYGKIDLVRHQTEKAMQRATLIIARSFFDEYGAGAARLTGIGACCDETASRAYGGFAEDDLVRKSDSTKPWEGKRETTAASIATSVIRTQVRDTHQADGINKEADRYVTTRLLFDSLRTQLEAQQIYRNDDEMAKAGFIGVKVDSVQVFPDDFCPATWGFAMTTKCIGFACYKGGYFERTAWRLIPNKADDKFMNVYCDMNLVVNNRGVHKLRTGLTA